MNKMRWILLTFVVLVFAVGSAYAGCGKKNCEKEMSKPCCAKSEQKPCCQKEGAKAAVSEEAPATRPDVLFACDCGGDCKCNTLSKSPGKCACGKELRWHHIVKVEGDEALLCTCGEGCKCSLDQNDSTKCACGNPVKRVSLKDSGLFFCNCGGSCTCNTVSDKPGECGCGMALKPA